MFMDISKRKTKNYVETSAKGEATICEKCGFSAFNNEKIMSHKRKGCGEASVPIQPVTVKMFKCNKCSYKSELASNRTHRSWP